MYVLSDFYNNKNHVCHIRKLLSSGNQSWLKQYNATAGKDDIPVSLAVTNTSNPDIFITGYGTGDITTVKYDTLGNLVWFTNYDCSNKGVDIATKMVMDSNCKIYITGSNCNGTYEDVKTIKYCACAPAKPGAISGSSAVLCAGSSYFFSIPTVAGATSYTWTLPNGWSIAGSSTGNTFNIVAGLSGVITVTANNAICSSIPQSLPITVHPLPFVNLGPDVIVSGGVTINVPGTGLKYLWSPGGSNISSLMVITTGTYSVTVTNISTGCSASDTIFVKVTSTATVETNNQYEILVSPNPTEGLINILCRGGATSIVEVITIEGRVVLEDKTFVKDSEPRTLNISNLASGIYYVRISGIDFTKTLYIVKQ